jgi:Rrf2 family protein
MKVSTKSEYGLRALIYLAAHSERETIPAREIAEKWQVPIKYLEHILKLLKEAGLVEGHVGVGGGYHLSRSSSLITAGEVIRALDGPIAPIGCVSTYQYEPCEFEPTCGLKTLWARTRAAILGVIDTTTVADLCDPASDRTMAANLIRLKSASKR